MPISALSVTRAPIAPVPAWGSARQGRALGACRLQARMPGRKKKPQNRTPAASGSWPERAGARRGRRRRAVGLEPECAPQLCIAQDLVCLPQLLELGVGLGVPRVLVWVHAAASATGGPAGLGSTHAMCIVGHTCRWPWGKSRCMPRDARGRARAAGASSCTAAELQRPARVRPPDPLSAGTIGIHAGCLNQPATLLSSPAPTAAPAGSRPS